MTTETEALRAQFERQCRGLDLSRNEDGVYTDEVFMEREGERVPLPAKHFNAIIKQLRRANRLALEAKGETS